MLYRLRSTMVVHYSHDLAREVSMIEEFVVTSHFDLVGHIISTIAVFTM